jgi:hypothetical protein
MTELTPRQILDAVRRGLEETWRKIDEGTLAQASKHPQSREQIDEFAEPGPRRDTKI